MTRLARMGALGVLLTVLGFWTAGAQTSLSVASTGEVGWWSRRPAAQPEADAKVFEVAHGLQGDESVAAIRVRIVGTVEKATLVLTETSAPLAGVATPKLKVCSLSSGQWLAGPHNPGPWADAPKPDCSGAAALTRSDKGEWTADITNRLTGALSETSVMVEPDEDPKAVVPPTYFLSMTALIDATGALDVPPTPTGSPPPVTIAPPSAASSSAIGARPSGPVTAAPTATATPSSAPASTVPAAPANSTVPRRLAVANSAPKKPWGKLVVLVPLALIAATGYTFGKKALDERLVAT